MKTFTVNELFERTYQMHWTNERYQKSGHAREVRALFQRHLHPAFGSKIATSVTAGQIRAFHKKLESTPTTANRCLEVLSRVYSFAEEFEMIPQGSNPCRLVRAFTETKRRRYATQAEIKRVWEALRVYSGHDPVGVAFIELLMLTGARPRSLMRARRDQIELSENMGFLRFEGKTTASTGNQEVVAIPESAMRDIVAKLPIREDGLLFGDVKYRGLWSKIQREAGCTDLWLRDWRRTFASIGLSNGVSLSEIGELLNHASPQTTKTYAKLLDDARAKAVTTISDKILGLIRNA